MARIHGGKHVECLATPALANYDAIRAHAQGIAYKVAYGNIAPPFKVGRTRFQRHQMWMFKPELGRIFNRNDTLVTWNTVRQHIEQSRLDRKSTRLNSSHYCASRMPSSA